MRIRYLIGLLLAVAACAMDEDGPMMPTLQFIVESDYVTLEPGDLFTYRVTETGDLEGWSVDTIDALGDTVQLRAFIWNDSVEFETPVVRWASTNPDRAVVNRNGRVTAVAHGSVRIRARLGEQAFDRTVVVRQLITSFTATPASLALEPNGASVPLIATATDHNGAPIVGTVRFMSQDEAVATVDENGVVTPGAEGFTHVRARIGGPGIVPADVYVPIRVGYAPAAFAITPEADTLVYVGETAQLEAHADDPLGNPIIIEWSSLAPRRVSVDQTGLITAIDAGRTSIIARAGLVADTAEIFVRPVVESVVLTLDKDTLEETESTLIVATSYDSAGIVHPRPPDWFTRDPGIATVDQNGNVTGVFEGTTWIVADRKGALDSVEVTIVPAATVSVRIDIVGHVWQPVTGFTLPADGTTELDVVLTFLDARGNPVRFGGQDLALVSQPLNQHTAGATLSGLTDNGDGTWSVKAVSPINNGTSGIHAYLGGVYWNTAGITFTGGNNLPTVPPPGPQCSIPAFPTPCSQVDYIAWQHVIEDAQDSLLTLPGTDADGQPLTAKVTELFALSPNATWKKADGSPLAVEETISDLAVRFSPHPDGFGPFYARIEYILTDGIAQSDTGAVRVFVDGVNDPPRPTLSSDLQFYEDQTTGNNFLMGGSDPEGNLFQVRFTLRPDLIGSMYHISPSGDRLITPATTTLNGSSDIAFGWPMYFVASPNDWGEIFDDFYNEFCYVLEEIPNGLHGPENCVKIRVDAVNDQPLAGIAGIGTAVDHNLTTSLIEGGLYGLPGITVTDPDIAISDPEFAVTIALSGSGVLDINRFDYEDAGVVFSMSDQLVTFAMKFDVTDQGFRPDLTLDNLLGSLTYTAAGGTEDTLTITVNDQGGYGVCSPADHTDPCPKQTTITIDMTIAPGTPPAAGTVMTLAPADS